jgi:hypothetical protein
VTPDSGQQRYCTNCGAEIKQEDQYCRSCGMPAHQVARVSTPEADVPTPSATQPRGQGERVGRSSNEFDFSNPIGSFLRTVRDLVINPVTFFRGMTRQGDFTNPLIFALVCVLVWTMLAALVGLSFSLIGGMQGAGAAFGRFVLSLIFYPLLSVAGLFIGAGIYHLLVTLVVGQERLGFEATFRVCAYTSVALLIAWIPILGWLVAPIWSVVLAILGIREAHQTTISKAALVVLILPAIVLLFFLLLLAIMLVLQLI